MTWNLSVRCWTCEGGVKLTNPVVICLNLVQVSLLDNSQYQGRDARLNFQFGVFNNSLNHFTVGKLEKVSFVTRKFCYKTLCFQSTVQLRNSKKLHSIGYQNIFIGDQNLDDLNTVKLVVKLNIEIADDDVEECSDRFLDSLIDDETSADMTVTARDKIFRVHKTILSARSTVLAKLIQSSKDDDETDEVRKISVMSEAYIVSDDDDEDSGVESTSSSGVKIDQLDSSSDTRAPLQTNINMVEHDQRSVLALLQYLYTGHWRMRDPGLVESLLALSAQYQVTGLKTLCEEALRECLQASTVASYLYLGHTLHCDHLKSSALRYCRDNHQNIIKVTKT